MLCVDKFSVQTAFDKYQMWIMALVIKGFLLLLGLNAGKSKVYNIKSSQLSFPYLAGPLRVAYLTQVR